MTAPEEAKKPVSRRSFIIGGVAAVVAVAAGVGGFFALQPTRPTPVAPTPAAPAPVAPTPEAPELVAPTPMAPATPITPVAPETPAPIQIIVTGATPAERAINAVRELKAMGKIPEGTRLKMLLVAFAKNNVIPEPGTVSRSGQQARILPKEWEEATGIPVDIDILGDLELYEKAISEGITKAGTWDYMSVRMDFLYDYIGADAILPIGRFVRQYEPEFDTGTCPLGPGPVANAYSTPDGEWWGYPACGDWFTYFQRHDIATDPKVQEAFEKEVGWPLTRVTEDVGQNEFTWDMVLDMARFFDGFVDKDGRKLRGSYYFRDPWFSNIEFYIRYYELGGLYFDRNGNPGLDRRIFIKVAEDMKALVPTMDPAALKCSWPCMYPDYGKGKVFQTHSWGSLAQFAILDPEGPGVAGMGAHPGPGYIVNGKLIRANILFDQTSYMVAKWGKTTQKIPDLPYLWGQWLSDPEISTVALNNPGAISDPWRTCHFKDPRLIQVYGAVWPPGPEIGQPGNGAMDAFAADLEVSVPPLRLIGIKEIQDIQGLNLNAFFTDVIDVDTAYQRINEGVIRVIEKFGVEREFELWKQHVQAFPRPLVELHRDYINAIGVKPLRA